MIHVLDFEGKIIDYIDVDDLSVHHAVHKRSVESETLDIEIDSKRAEHFKKRHRIVIEDKTGKYREFVIDRAVEEGRVVVVEATASYLVDLKNARPLKKGTFEKKGVNQKVSEILEDSGWSVNNSVFAEITTTTWDKTIYAHELLAQIAKEHGIVYDYEVVIDGYEVVKRLVNIEEPTHLFKGREIVYGKDLASMKRTIDYTEVRTALYIVGPEEDKLPSKVTMVFDDDAQEQFGDAYHYIWDIYEPTEGVTAKSTEEELQALGKKELAKRNSAALSYEVNVVDLEKEYPHEVINFGDIVRIKNPDFTPSLYAESEVIGIEHELISDNCNYSFGNIVEKREDELLAYFRSRMAYINQKLNDGLTNVNTIVADVVEGKLEYFERKIFKGTEPPASPVNDMLWLDTSNPDVAVLRRYWNGEWINSTAEKAKDIGAVTREQALYSELTNTFTNLSIQHAKLLKEMYEIINSEYLTDSDLRQQLNSALDNTIEVYSNIQSGLNEMTSETATIGKLISVQELFLTYRERMQQLYNVVEQAKISIDKRFKLLQSQYTDEKYNDAMNIVAGAIGGEWNPETKQLTAKMPDEERLEQIRAEITNAYTQQISSIEDKLRKETDSKIVNTKEEISATIKKVEESVTGLESTISDAEKNALQAAKEYADAQDNLKKIEAEAYADGKISEEEERAIADAQAKLQEAKTYAEQQKTLAIDEANNKIVEQIKPITTRITTAEQSMKVLEDKLLLTATKKDVTETLNTELEPVKRDVQEQKSQIQVMSDSIDSKVSKSDYTTDQNNIVNRLTESESQTKQLSDRISQTVSKTEFQSGLDNIQIGTRNLFQSYNPSVHGSTVASTITNTQSFRSKYWAITLYSADYLKKVLVPGEEYVYSYEIEIVGLSDYPVQYSGKHGIIFYSASTSKDSILSYKDVERLEGNKFKITQVFVAPQITDHRFVAYSGLYTPDGRLGTQRDSNLVEIRNLILKKGNKATDWSPAPEDVERDTNQKLTTTKAEVLIEAEQTSNRVSKEVYNSSIRTLDRTTSTFINNVSTGMTFTYDENGNIQSQSIGPDGIKFDATKFEINDGDVVVKNGRTTIKDAYIDKLFSNQATINKLNSIDIQARTIRASDNQASVNVEGGTITMNRTDGARLNIGIDGITMYNSNGSKRFTVDTSIVESAALGTSNANVYLAASKGFEARVVDRAMLPSDGSISSYDYLPIRSLALKFPQNSNGYVGVDKEFRIMSEGLLNGTYRDLRASDLYANRLKPNGTTNLYLGTDNTVRIVSPTDDNSFKDLVAYGVYADLIQNNPNTSSTNLYLRANEEVRVTASGSTSSYKNVRANGFLGTFLDVSATTNAVNMYVRPAPNGALCVTQRNTTDTFLAVKASQGIWTSSEKYKENIEEWNDNVLQKIKNTKLYEYDLISEKNAPNRRRHHGVIIERQTPEEWVVEDGVDQYQMTTWSLKAIQELLTNIELMDKRIKELEDKLNER